MGKTEEKLLADLKALELAASKKKAQLASIEARKRADADKRLTRQKILVGAFILSIASADKSFAIPGALTHVLEDGTELSLDKFLKRDNDRALFGLAPLPDPEKKASSKEPLNA